VEITTLTIEILYADWDLVITTCYLLTLATNDELSSSVLTLPLIFTFITQGSSLFSVST
jgi:hypothetical protein